MEMPKYLTEALEIVIRTDNSELQRIAKLRSSDLEKGDTVFPLQKSLNGFRQAGINWQLIKR